MKYAPEWVQEFKRCEQWIQDAVEYSHGTFTIESIFEDMAAGNLQLWPGPNSAIVTQVVYYPGMKVMHLFLAGGNLEELQELYNQVEEYAKSIECKAVTLTGRPGWAKSFLRDKNFVVKEIQMFKGI